MWKHAAAISLMLGTLAFADEPPVQRKEPSARVECHGRLRHGVVAIGGETTGTTITFDGRTWELKLPDETSRALAMKHHKGPMTAIGALRRVAGTETTVRWIVDVERLSERDPQVVKEAAHITLEGTLRVPDTAPGKPGGMELEAAGITWPLDLNEEAALLAQAKSLAGKTVVLSGRLMGESGAASPMVIRVVTLEMPKAAPIPK